MVRDHVARNYLIHIGLACAFALLATASPVLAAKVRRSSEATGIGVNGLIDSAGHLRPIADDHTRMIGAGGVHLGRTDAVWSWAEFFPPSNGRHRYDWSNHDDVARVLAADGVRWLPVIAYGTSWAGTVPGNERSPPRSNADYAAYAEAFARRYGRGGSFWAMHPSFPQLPVTSYEVWNEPNLDFFFQPTPDPARYASMYLAAKEVIERADPQATVVVGGLAPYADGYLKAMYAAHPELKGEVDAVAYHPYGPDAELVLRLVRKLRATLDDLGEDDVPLWITEVGWPTQGTGGLSAEAVPHATRAANLGLVMDGLLGSNCAVQTVSPYTWATLESDPGHDEHWLGIFHPNTAPTEAGSAYLAAVARNDQAADDGPQLALDLCYDRGTKFAKPLRLGVDVERASPGCRRATVTYRGRPVNGVRATFGDDGQRTDLNGVAESCENGDVSARILDVASGEE